MTKILVWVLVILAVLVGLRLINIAKAKRRTGTGNGRSHERQAEAMVRCVRCGMYLPRAEATEGPAGPVCSDPSCASRR